MEEAVLIRRMKMFEKNTEWLSKNCDELQEKYDGKVFAIKDQRVIQTADTVEELIKKLEAKNEDITFLLVEKLPPRDVSFIL